MSMSDRILLNPKVTVIIPNYNHARYLPIRIDSVLSQSYQNIEVILMDDCSSDNSRNILAQYAAQDARIRLVFNEQNSGSTFKQWNKGFALAKGDYIWIAESDDYASSDFLSNLLSPLEQDKEVGLAYSASYSVNENNEILDKGEKYFDVLDDSLWKSNFILPGVDLLHRFMPKSNIIPNASAVLIRKSIIQQIGPADETKRLTGDWLYWAQVMARSKIAYCAEPLNYFRRHTNNVRSKSAISGLALLEFIDVLAQLPTYGSISEAAYEERVSFIYDAWLNSIVYENIPYRAHKNIYKSLHKIDNLVNKRIADFLFSKRLRGIKMLVGDRWLASLNK